MPIPLNTMTNMLMIRRKSMTPKPPLLSLLIDIVSLLLYQLTNVYFICSIKLMLKVS